MIASIIIARGGSKRLLRKNVLPFCGRPLVEWSILQSVYSHNLGPDKTYLSTDDDEIAEIGHRNGIHVIRRPAWANPDEITGSVVMNHAIEEIRKTRPLEILIQPLATSPVRFPDDMDRAINRYYEIKKTDPACTAIEWLIPLDEITIHKYINDKQCVYWIWNKSRIFATSGVLAAVLEVNWYFDYYKNLPALTDKELDYSIFWLDPKIAGAASYFINGQWFQQFDIDTQDDFDLCEWLMEKYVLKGRGEKIYRDYKKGEGEAVRGAMEEIEK